MVVRILNPAARVESLSFVADRDGKVLPKPVGNQLPRCFWNIRPTDDYLEDCRAGEFLALEYLRFAAARHAEGVGPGFLPNIVADMPSPLTGIEVGFLTMLDYALQGGRREARRVSDYWARCRAERAASDDA